MLSFIYFFKIDANPVSVNMLREKKKKIKSKSDQHN